MDNHTTYAFLIIMNINVLSQHVVVYNQFQVCSALFVLF